MGEAAGHDRRWAVAGVLVPGQPAVALDSGALVFAGLLLPCGVLAPVVLRRLPGRRPVHAAVGAAA